MRQEIKKITPEYAKELLKKNSANRPLSMRNIDFLCREITDGKWMLSHQGICISKEGNLIDGQHRLHAVIKSGIPIEVMVVSEADSDLFKVVDVGKKRNSGDILAIEGFNYHKELPGLINKIIQWENHEQITRSGPKIPIEIDHLLEFARSNETSLYDAIKTVNRHSKNKVYNKAVGAFMVWMLSKIDDSLIGLMDQIISGISSDKHLIRLREELVDLKLRRLQIHPHELITKTLLSILCSIKQKNLKASEFKTSLAYEYRDQICKIYFTK
ncbi:hypothetical protein [Ekhidna sp.]|jgi:hypothetical protein|uniref:hypothetical protein n=1 Tax=Ekhidna sp. TaxID=2608089 RepID=UPI0032ED69B3